MRTHAPRRGPRLVAAVPLVLAACVMRPGGSSEPTATAPAAPAATVAGAKKLVSRIESEGRRLYVRLSTADWINKTYINHDTEQNFTWANTEFLAFQAEAIREAARYRGLRLDPETARKLHLLRVSSSLVAPSDARKREEVAGLTTKMEGIYGKGKWCGGPTKKCRDLQELSNVLRTSRKPNELLDAWVGWRTVSREMRPIYQRFVALSNEGAGEVGFADTGEMWRSRYDMPPDAFRAETDRLWQQVRPLYEQLHCYVRGQLNETYGDKVAPASGPIPAHLLGNMWAQEWDAVYPLVEPYPGRASLDVTAGIKRKRWDAKEMVRVSEAFFTSLGLDPLPKSFWERSLFTKPRDRDVVCHASAWDVNYSGDLRIKMCIEPNAEDFVTIHHELGHVYYFHAYNKLPILFQDGANDGFHEAIGDALTLSITPGYLQKRGLIGKVPKDDKALINFQMMTALQKVAFLPFGKLIDEWRWDVFAGKVAPGDYNKAWWSLRERLQGVKAPVERTEEDFDPGAKYHIPGNTPYARYFLARILQFQFHRAMCKIIGHTGPLHECSIHGNQEAGKRLQAMLALGSSRPWPDALEALTGERKLDASALTEYFAPLSKWLEERNRGQQCGW